MEIVMLGVTIASLLVAVVTSVVAWRLSRAERTRAAVRVAALTAAASEPDTVADRVAVGEASPAPWSPARVSAFTASSRPAPRAARVDSADTLRSLGDGFLGTPAAATSGGSRQRGLAMAALVMFLVALGGGYWVVFGDRTARPAVGAANGAAPLELVSLTHERRGTRLAVTGLVRNPVAGAPIGGLSAVVFLFDAQGGFITSARAPVDFLTLGAGDESPFVIDLQAPANVARYRVSFRTDAGVVSHVDRRGQDPVGSLSAVEPDGRRARAGRSQP